MRLLKSIAWKSLTFKSIKVRLTLLYVAAIAVLLVVFGAVAYSLLARQLYRNLDDSLHSRAVEIQGTLKIYGREVRFEQKVSDIVMIYDADGALLQRLGPNVRFSHIEGIVQKALFGKASFQSATTTEGQDVRLYAAPHNADSKTRVAIVVGKLPGDIQALLAVFRVVIINAGLVVVLLAGLGGLFLAERTLRPVERITGIADEIGEGDLARRIDVESEDELGHLASTLNGMIGRLEEAFDKQRRFVADASHELRTPLAVMQAEVSLALGRERTPEEYRKALEALAQEVGYMSDLVGKLLALARSDAGSESLHFEDVSVAELFAELSQDVAALAQEKGLQYTLGPAEGFAVRGDRTKLKQLLLSVFDNAVRYTPAGGTISASIAAKNGNAIVSVTDTGVGISAEHLPFVFDRFYRVDKARSRAEGGTGLGLAIAKSIAKAHGGDIEVESLVDKGTTVRIILPLADLRT